MIEFKNVNKIFQQKNSEIQALKDVSFKVEGKIYLVLSDIAVREEYFN